MEKSYLFIIGLGAEAMALGISQLFPNAASWIWGSFFWVGLLLIVLGIWIWIKEWRKKSKAGPETLLSLRFSGGTETPLPEEVKNIYRWYTLQFITIVPNANIGKENESRIWTIFLVFDEEVNPKRLGISSEGFTMPRHEVKDFGPRHAIIVIGADLPAGVLNIKVDQ